MDDHLELHEAHLQEIMGKIREIRAGKYHDYSNTPLLKGGHKGFYIRLDSKLIRLQNLIQDGKVPWNESIDDTFVDMVNYLILWHMYYKGDLK